MAELKYVINVDDRQFKAKMADIAKASAKGNDKMIADVKKTMDKEKAQRASMINKINEQTKAVRALNAETLRGGGTIKSGTVVSPADIERAKVANEAYASSVHKTTLSLKKQEVASKAVSNASKAQMVTLEALKLELADYQAKAALANNPKQLKLYNAEIQTLQGEITRMSNVGKAGFDDMGNAVKKSTGAMGKAWGAIRKLSYILPGIGIAGLLAFAIDPIMKYLGKLEIFNKKTTEAEAAQRSLAAQMGDAGSVRAEAILQIEEMSQKFYLARRNIISKKEALEAYNTGIGKVLGATNDLNIAEQRTIDNGDKFIELMFKKARAAAVMKLYTEEMSKAAQEMAKTDDQAVSYMLSGTKGSGLRTATGEDMYEANARRNREAAAKPFIDRANQFKKMYLESNKDIITFAKENGLNITEQAIPKFKASKSIEAASNLYQEIADLKEEYTRKAMTQDEAEIQAIADKFKTIKRKVELFNKDPKNKIKIDVAELQEIEDHAINEARKRQQEAINREIAEEQARSYASAWEASLTHGQKLAKIEAEYQAQLASIKKDASEEQLQVLKAARDKEISDEVAANLKIQENWENTFNNMNGMSRSAVQAYLKHVKARVDAELEAGKITADQHAQMLAEINKANSSSQTSFGRLTDAFKKFRNELNKSANDSESTKSAFRDLAGAVSESANEVNKVIGAVAQSVQQLNIGDENLDKALDNVMGIVDGIGEIGKGIASGNPIDIITGSIKLLTSAIDLFNTKDRRLQKQIDQYRDQLASLGAAYRKLERDIASSVGNEYFTDSRKAIGNMEAQIIALGKVRDAESRKKKTDKNKIAEIDNQIIELNNSIEDTQQAISEMILQSNFKQFSDNLATALVSAFEQGKSAIDAMNATFEDFIKNAIANSLKLAILEPIVNDMMEAATSYAKGNDNSLIGFDWSQWKGQLADASQEVFGALDQAYKGLGLSKGGQGDAEGGLRGTIGRTITEDTASQLMGQFMGFRMAQKASLEVHLEHLEVTKGHSDYAYQNLLTALKIEQNTFRTAENTGRLAAIENHLASLDRKSKNGDAIARGLGIEGYR